MTKRLIGISFLAATLAYGCATNAGRSAAAVPLEIPEPPPKPAILPVPAPDAPPARPAAPVPAERPPAAAPARTTPPSPSQPATASAAPAATPATNGPAVATPEPSASSPAAELRPAGSAARALSPIQVRESLDRAKQKLDAIDRRKLNAGKRADYDSARRFLAQADTAVKGNNLMLAQSSVEKAEALANGLR
jgi:hypothetical protein